MKYVITELGWKNLRNLPDEQIGQIIRTAITEKKTIKQAAEELGFIWEETLK